MRMVSRCALMLGVAAGFASAPTTAAAQGFTLNAGCLPGSACDAVRFSFEATSATPVALLFLKLTFSSSDWSFTGSSYSGEDLFSPFGPFNAALAADRSAAKLDFEGDIGWFEIHESFTSYFDIAASGTGNGAFTYLATDDQGVEFTGSGQIAVEPNVVPEPISMILLGTGLFGIGAARARRRSRTQAV